MMIWFKFWGGKPFVETPLPHLTVICFLVGCLSIMNGFVAEILMRTYHEAAKSPTYVVRHQYRGGKADLVAARAPAAAVS